MSPERPSGSAYRAVGGDVISRFGRPLQGSGIALLAFLSAEATRLAETGDAAAALSCGWMAADLAQALAAADDWRKAANFSRDFSIRGCR